jgi:hypothetical protein
VPVLTFNNSSFCLLWRMTCSLSPRLHVILETVSMWGHVGLYFLKLEISLLWLLSFPWLLWLMLLGRRWCLLYVTTSCTRHDNRLWDIREQKFDVPSSGNILVQMSSRSGWGFSIWNMQEDGQTWQFILGSLLGESWWWQEENLSLDFSLWTITINKIIKYFFLYLIKYIANKDPFRIKL